MCVCDSFVSVDIVKYSSKSDGREGERLIILIHSSRLVYHSREVRSQKLNTASHTHSQEQRESKCMRVCARLAFATHAVQNLLPRGMAPPAIDRSSHLNGIKTIPHIHAYKSTYPISH